MAEAYWRVRIAISSLREQGRWVCILVVRMTFWHHVYLAGSRRFEVAGGHFPVPWLADM